MPPDESKPPPPLDYAGPQFLDARPKSLFELVSLHFSVGTGAGMLAAFLVWLWRYRSNLPITFMGCGIGVVMIQLLFFWIGVGIRRLISSGPLEEWRPAITVVAGFVGSILAYLPAVGMSSDRDLKRFLLIPLFLYPVFAGFITVRRGRT